MSRQTVNDSKSREIVTKMWVIKSCLERTINRETARGFLEHRVHLPNSIPGAFIFLPGQLVPPGKQQSEGSELLGVKGPFLLPLQLQI